MIVDYLTFTFAKEDEKKLPGLVGEIDAGAVPLETKNGYTEDWCLWGSGRLKWRHQGEMLARLSLPGSALALFRESGGNVSSLVITIGDAGGRCTRVDFAFDWELAATPVIDRIAESIQGGNYTSRWKLENSRSSYRIRSLCGMGDTLYLGSPKSDCRLRIYDKAAERGVEGPWLRFEFQVRKERADAAICLLTVGAGEAVEYIKALILGYIDIKEPQVGDSNKRRWPTADWWAEMWGKQKSCLCLGSEMPTEGASRAWFEKIAPSLAVLLKLDGGDLEWLHSTVSQGGKAVEDGGRWRSVHDAKLKAWQEARAAGGANGEADQVHQVADTARVAGAR
jgi:hypothetical protein